jgi:hypothetical protein
MLDTDVSVKSDSVAAAAGAARYHMYVWSRQPKFLAVAQARCVADARRLLLEGDLGESGDGSCFERDAARRWILETQPLIWYRNNAEFVLTDSAELQEIEKLCDAQARRIRELEAQLAALTASMGPTEELSAKQKEGLS